MTRLLEQALAAVSRHSEAEQNDIARTILQLAGEAADAPVPLTETEERAITRSRGAAARGEFASAEQVRAVWSKHGL